MHSHVLTRSDSRTLQPVTAGSISTGRSTNERRPVALVAEFTFAIAVLWAISMGTNEAVRRLALPIPSNALAMLVTFGLLSSGCIPQHSLDRGAAFLVRHLAFFFVPFAVGIIALPEMSALLVPLAAIVVVSVGAGIVASAAGANAVRARNTPADD